MISLRIRNPATDVQTRFTAAQYQKNHGFYTNEGLKHALEANTKGRKEGRKEKRPKLVCSKILFDIAT